MNETAPKIKVNPLINYLINTNIRIKNVIDFGCGTGQVIAHLSKELPSIDSIYGVECDLSIYPQIKESVASIKTNIEIISKLNDINIKSRSFSLVVLIDVLHHIERESQVIIINKLLSLLKPNGFIYIYEDSWQKKGIENYKNINISMTTLQKQFEKLSTNNKIKLFLLNEFWSNCWCYGRELSIKKHSYRSYEDWISLLNTIPIKLVDHGFIPFSAKRLHGVPSAWIIGQKAE